ncbi:MAG: arginine deiminase family protein [Cyclobacteriaceae bacterium]|nr:arginine deiminase family protein [Cyclobacteriaceae bacterium]
MIDINIRNETSGLKAVVLGIADSIGPIPTLEEAYDPKSKEHIKKGTFPLEEELIEEITGFLTVLKKHNVQVYRPQKLPNVNQVFSRDIGFVIDEKFIIPNILRERKEEMKGVQYIVDLIEPENVIETNEDVRLEGGDVMPWNDCIFVGYSEPEDFDKYKVARTNVEGVEFLEKNFPSKKVYSFELKKSDDNAKENALHLDCCFQPIGKNQAIIYKGGFKNEEDFHFLVNYFGKNNVIEISQEEMYDMNSNIFSISPTVVVSEKNFHRLNAILREKGFTVEEIDYSETAKMEGLLRCSTMPLIRE